MRQAQSSQNKQEFLANMLQNNPNIANIATLLKTNNGSLQQVAQLMAQQKGFDLNMLIQELQR